MSFLGMGPLEIVIILLIAFVVLGPERMVDAGRFLGRVVAEGRKLASEMPRVVVEDDDIKVVNAGETISMTRGADSSSSETISDASQSQDPLNNDGPVAFTPTSEATPGSVEDSRSAERGNTHE